MENLWLALLLSLTAAFADVIGGSLILIKRLRTSHLVLLTAVGSGFLLGATFLDRLPESIAALPHKAPLFILTGYVLMFIFERMNSVKEQDQTEHVHKHTGTITYIGLLIHTFIDGAIIAGAFTISTASGILLFLAITLHKIPEGYSMASIRLATGGQPFQSFLTAVGLAISTVIGAVVTLFLGAFNAFAIEVLMSVATGTFIYITTSNLIPLLKNEKHRLIVPALVFSIGFFYFSLFMINKIGLE